MSSYLDGRRVECSMQDYAACDWCGEGVAEWHRWQQREGCERDEVCRVLDELADSCAACWVTGQGGEDEDWFLHSLVECRIGQLELLVDSCNNF
jgi:hypothetical protein